MSEIAGVVLAAGASRRMGTNKALLEYGGKTFLDNMCDALTAGGCRPVMAVVSRPFDEIKDRCRLQGAELVVNPDPDRGQISSLRCAIERVRNCTGILVVTVDQGSLVAESVSQVKGALPGFDVAVARYKGQSGHPTAFSARIFPALESPAADQGARQVVAECTQAKRVRFVDLDDPGVVRNLNTPDEYEAFCKTSRR